MPIDPLMAYLGGTDGNRDIDVRATRGPLAELAARYHVGILLVRHLTKTPKDAALYRGGGSIAFAAAARVVLLAVRNPNDAGETLITSMKNNAGTAAPTVGFSVKTGELVVEVDRDGWPRWPIKTPSWPCYEIWSS